MAYISKYGLDDIHGISIDASVANGAEIISEPISGKFTVDANAINRMVKDLDALGMFSVDSFVTSSIDLLSKSGAIDSVIGVVKEELYGKIVKDENGELKTTQAQRTGCSMCGFGIHLEKRPHRFDLLRERNPKQWDALMYHLVQDDDGDWFGWAKVLDYIGVDYL